MGRLAQLRRRAIDFRARVEQLFRLEHVVAIVALVRTGTLKPADITGAFHVAVGQEAPGGRGIPLRAGFSVKEAVLEQGQEHGLRHLEVVGCVSGGEQIIADAGLLEQLNELVMEALVHLFHWESIGISTQGDGSAVRVGTGDHQHTVSLEPVVARHNITRQVRPGDVTHVYL